VTLGGRSFRALRHGMAGQAGYEFIGDHADAEFVRDALLKAGEDFGLVQVGAMAYATNGVESGWIPTPTPGIYSDPSLREYREWLKVFSFEGQKPLHGSAFSPEIEDYYVSPWELGYGRSISFNHDFLGRDALQAAKDNVPRTKVTLELDRDDVREVLGADLDYLLTYGRYGIEAGGEQIGITFYTAHIDRLDRVLALSLVDNAHAAPGTRVELVYGEHPGAGMEPDADLGFARLRATVQSSPYNEYARTKYRAEALA
jgi:glycine cleavage system aminomethyltransferase T